MKRYNPKDIEPKWQAIWDETGVYTADLQSTKPKYIAMSMFNYPSGAGIHIGHALNYTISDVKARFKRQQGYESYHPVGWDAFGLPAENYAIKAGVSPQQSMAQIIPSYHKQYKAMGWSNDWEKEIATHLPEYYKWTQWIFTQMHKHGLAYQDSRMQWWCETDNTVLANEQVIDGKCWRHDGPDDPLVQKKEVKQWFFKITDYADELLEATDDLDWTEAVKTSQKNWIGKSQGAEISFAIDTIDDKLTVFTTRPDTLYGATFLVVAPEHPLLDALVTPEHVAAVKTYRDATARKTEVERQENKQKTGEFTGSYALHPITSGKIPIWTADYVLAGYGTGAIMAVPAHDDRDYAFAQVFDLPIIDVIAPEYGEPNPDAEWVDGCTILVFDKQSKQLIGLDWHGARNWTGLIAGGLSEGEDYETCARRELAEEAGMHIVEKLIPLGSPVYAHYKHRVKPGYRRARTQGYLAVVDGKQTEEAQREEHETFDVAWYDGEELYKKIENLGSSEHWAEIVRRGLLASQAVQADKAVDLGAYDAKEGIMINSGPYTDLPSSEAREKIIEDLSAQGVAAAKSNYKMRDWSVGRQRYWGAPIPIIHCAKCGPVLVPEQDLPVILLELDDFKPNGDGRSALARATDWLHVPCPQCGGSGERETDTLDTYICSSWYMYRYFDPHNQQQIFDSEIVNKWAPIDFYNGGDHATAHLLYARFVTRFFSKIGLVNEPEPFKQMLFNGKVTAADGTAFSKSKGNGIDPLEIIDSGYGADALRTYLMFASPLELTTRWDSQGVPGTYRFLSRIWNLVQEYQDSRPIELTVEQQQAIHRATHQMIRKVTEDLELNHYNTAIAAAMTCVNELYKLKATSLGKHDVWQQSLSSLVACVAPFAPHVAEELWHELGHSTTAQKDSWPLFDEQYLIEDTITIIVQVNGKLRAQLELPAGSTQEQAEAAARADSHVQKFLSEATVRKVIFVPDKLLNFVV